MAELIVIHELQDYLVAQGLAQLPGADPSLTVPVVVADPEEGALQPRQGSDEQWLETATISLRSSVAPARPVEAFLERHNVEVIVQAIDSPTAVLTQRAITRLLADRWLWTMGQLLVEHSSVWRGDQPLPQQPQSFAGYARTQSFFFLCRNKALAGLPYAP